MMMMSRRRLHQFIDALLNHPKHANASHHRSPRRVATACPCFPSALRKKSEDEDVKRIICGRINEGRSSHGAHAIDDGPYSSGHLIKSINRPEFISPAEALTQCAKEKVRKLGS